MTIHTEDKQEFNGSFWLNDAPYQIFRSTPELPQTTDVVVIGGGIAGVSTAYWLGKQGVNVTLLERRGLSAGATGRNGGHLHPSTALHFSEAVRLYGIETALALWHFAEATAKAIQDFVAQHKVDCDLHCRGSVSLALDEQELAELQDSAEAQAKYGLGGEYWDAKTCAARMHSQSFLGGLFLPNPGQLWAAKLVFAIAAQALQLGTNVQTQTTVEAIEQENSNLSVKTSRGTIKAQHVVHTTNAWARELLPFVKNIIIPVRGQVMITESVPILWNFSFATNYSHEYCIQRLDGRIVFGGRRQLAPNQEIGIDDDSGIEPRVSQGLRDFLSGHFPPCSGIKVEQEWTGIMAFSPDYNPLVGPVAHRPGEYIAAGFTGHGMPTAFLAAKAVASMIMGYQPDSFVDAFLPSRFMI